MVFFNLNSSKSLSDPLHQQDESFTNATRAMSLSLLGKSTRPLKKRRIVSISIERDDASQQAKDAMKAMKAKKRKVRRSGAAKKQSNAVISPVPPSSPARMVKNSVTWNDREGNMIHLQPDPTQLHPYFNESDLWYTREDYREYLLDRLRTIESHRYMTANNMSNTNENDSSSYCMRGLEIFHDDTTKENFQSNKKLYYSTIRMEQVRQGILGIKDPERFRVLVAPQSDLALHQAQERAGQDEREVYPFRAYSAARDFRAKPHENMCVSSFSDMQRLGNIMDSIYGGDAASSDTCNSTLSTHTPFHENNMVSSFETGAESTGGASMVSDVASTSSSNSASSSESSTSGQPLFAENDFRKLQERSMRRLIGIYQQTGEGTERASETDALFKYARRDSLLGIRNSAASDTANASGQSSVWAVPEDTTPSQQEQVFEMLHHEQLLQDQHQQQRQQHQYQQQQQQQAASSEETDPSVQEQLIEMLRCRQLLQDHHQQQQISSEEMAPSPQEQMMEMLHRRQFLQDQHQQQRQQHQYEQQQQQEQQRASSKETDPSLQEQMMNMLHYRQLLQDQQQKVSSVMDTIGNGIGGDRSSNSNNNSNNNLLEQFMIQQHQHQQEHKSTLQQAFIAMNTPQFPIRRDTLSLVHTSSGTR